MGTVGIVVVLCIAANEVPPVALQVQGGAVSVAAGANTFIVSLKCPRLAFEGLAPIGDAPPQSVTGDPASGETLKVAYAPLALAPGETVAVTLFLQWSREESVLRKWAEVRFSGSTPRLLTEVTLEDLPSTELREELLVTPPQSYPVYIRGFFIGIEFPVAATRVEGDRVVVGHRPGATVKPGEVYATRKAVYGACNNGSEKESFFRYIQSHRPGKAGIHVNYNSWWTSSVPFSEAEILGLMKTFEDKLYKPYGVPLDTFTIDMGWSNAKSLWEIDSAMFPQGFTGIQQGAERMGARLGLWISPSSCYPPALDNQWAADQGYETFSTGTSRLACLGGEKYAAAFRDRLVDMLKRYNIRQVKLDGYALTCPETNHGHAPGPLSSEAVAEGGIRAFQAMRDVAPDVWLEATCFGWNPSPWWLFYVSSVIGTFGDDAPRGRVPAPVYRESYTTGRDFFNLQGAAHLQVPVAAQEVLGVIHQTPEPFLDDAVITFLRGHEFVPLYVNPKFMDEKRWKTLAELIRWARANPLVYEHTEPILPISWQNGKAPRFTNDAPMPREPYGYAHWGKDGGLVVLRNPWIAPATVPLEVRGEGTFSVVSLYPDVRLYAKNLSGGAKCDVPLAPYETRVLSVGSGQVDDDLPDAVEKAGSRIRVEEADRRTTRVQFEGTAERIGPDWTELTEPGGTALELAWKGRVTTPAPETRLLVLLEGPQTPSQPLRAECKVNGNSMGLRPVDSDAGWSATGMPPGPDRWLFLEAGLPQGSSEVSLELLTGTDCSRVSAWAYATARGLDSGYSNALPAPETIPLDDAALFEPAPVPESLERRPAIVERIDGVYLDALAPASATQGWGELQKNQSVTQTPMAVGSRPFQRGLGTHSPSRLVYDLDGTTYSRFQTMAGAQRGSNATVTFEVWVDGMKVWESGAMTSTDEAKPVDIDVHGAKKLELIVGNGGNGIGADHANWGDAKLLR